jgi:lipopolysaccharide/colanic/teichoic acid biosynthesis glycosyltransferase
MWDRFLAGLGLLLCAPFLLLIAAAIWLEDGSPVLFRQIRVGRFGSRFKLLKFRSMRRNQPGKSLTAEGDRRVTRCGRFLRNYKLDELPQLWNVVRGEMSLIGPRPEVPQFVALSDPAWSAVLQVKPGITDLATLAYRNEEKILASYADVERGYREVVLPAKLALNKEYLMKRSLWSDIKLLALTIHYSFMPADLNAQQIKQAVLSIPKESGT